MAAPPELIDDVAAEIFLRLPPDEPEHVFVASLVCKRWLRLLSDPAFLRRYRTFHGAPPLLPSPMGYRAGGLPDVWRRQTGGGGGRRSSGFTVSCAAAVAKEVEDVFVFDSTLPAAQQGKDSSAEGTLTVPDKNFTPSMILHKHCTEGEFARQFGNQVCNDLVSLPVPVLPPHLLSGFSDSAREKVCAPKMGQQSMITKKMTNGGTVEMWTCLNFSDMRLDEVQRFCMDLVQMCHSSGMDVNLNPIVEVKSADPSNDIANALKDVQRRVSKMLVEQETRNHLLLLIVILPDACGSYGKIKRACEGDTEIVAQFFFSRHASRPNKQYLEDVAAQIKYKIGERDTGLNRAVKHRYHDMVSSTQKAPYPSTAEVMIATASINESNCAELVPISAVKRSEIKSMGCFNTIGRVVTSKASVFDHSSELVLQLGLREGLRGGHRRSGISGSNKIYLRSHIADLKKKPRPKWFDKILIPEGLRRSGPNAETFVVRLGDDALLTLVRLLASVEIKHKKSKSYGGFSECNIEFLSEYDIYDISGKGIALVDLTPESYQLDLNPIVEIIDEHFKYETAPGVWEYPAFVRQLVDLMSNARAEISDCKSTCQRSLIFNNMATWSEAQQINFFTSTVLYVNGLLPHDNQIFRQFFEAGDDTEHYWEHHVTGQGAPLIMSLVYHHGYWDANGNWVSLKTYYKTEYSQFDYCRCLITHALKFNVTAKQVIAAIYLIWKDQLSRVYRRLIAYASGSGTDAIISVPFSSDIKDIPYSCNIRLYQLLGLSEQPMN